MKKKEKFLYCKICKKWTTHIQFDSRAPFVCEVDDLHPKLQKLLKEFLEKNPGRESEIGHAVGASIPAIKRWAEGENFPNDIVVAYTIGILKEKLGKK